MASDSDFTKPRPGWGCCHLVSFQPEMRYHVPMHAEKKRTKNFAPPLEASVQNTLKTLRDPEMVRRDPQLTFLANGPVDVAAWGQGSTERAPAGTSASHGISMSHSAPTLEFMAGGRRKVASLEPLAQTAPTARGSSTRGSKRGSTSGSSRQRADAARAEAAEAAGGGALRGSSSFRSLPLLRPMAASLVGSLQCGLDRKEKLEAAAETFDGRHGALVTHACERTDAVDREPHNEDIRVAAYIATSELTRHRFFVPERAGGPAAKFEKRDRPKAKPKVKELWTLPKSIWAGRAKWCDAADFYDTEEVRRLHFEAVWDRVLRSGLRKFIGRNDASGADPDEATDEVRTAMWQQDALLSPLFEFYSALNGFCGVIGLNNYSQFVDDCQLSNQKAEFTKKSDLDRLFIAVDTAGKKSDEEAQNDDGFNRAKALSIDEFVNCIVNLATMRYVLTAEEPSIASAVVRLFRADIEPRCHPTTFLDANAFRREECYNEATDLVLKKQEPRLRLLFGAICEKRGPAKKLLSFEAWAKFIRRIDGSTPLIGIDLTERDVSFAFAWSRMVVAQPYTAGGGVKNRHVPFEGFLEALCRVAALKALPTDDELYAPFIDEAILAVPETVPSSELPPPTAASAAPTEEEDPDEDPLARMVREEEEFMMKMRARQKAAYEIRTAKAVEDTLNQLVVPGTSCAGRYLHELKAELPQAYDDLQATRATSWGDAPRQPLSRCIDHLLSIIFFTIGTERDPAANPWDERTGEMGEKEINKFYKEFDSS